ncbi:hypothetical protein LDENG_00034090 [Lucifuga dentata]|nr:hypothetical protein LDENG_00034090 [Lucifuga dentata]
MPRKAGGPTKSGGILFAEPGGLRSARCSKLTQRTASRKQGYDGTELNMGLFWILFFSSLYLLARGQGVYGKTTMFLN